MTWYEFLLFVHIAATVCWIGSGFLLVVLALRAERDGGRLTPASLADTRRLLALARIDYVTLFLVIAVMVIKPTGDDTGVLLAFAAIWVLGLAYSINRHQAVGQASEATA